MTGNKALARTEIFSDGVFAIAITLLVLDIKVPTIGSILSVNVLVNAIVHLWPSYFAFLYSFGGILFHWKGGYKNTLRRAVLQTTTRFAK
jgi:uncharacterized membrane protein